MLVHLLSTCYSWKKLLLGPAYNEICYRIIYNTLFAQNQYNTRVIFDRVKSDLGGKLLISNKKTKQAGNQRKWRKKKKVIEIRSLIKKYYLMTMT